MEIIYTKSYMNSFKKLYKHNDEYNNLLKTLKIIRNANDFNDLLRIPILKKYNFERLKYNLNGFYSLNLSKKGGKIRLIVKPNNKNEIEIFLVYISYKHYEDFNIKKVIIDEQEIK